MVKIYRASDAEARFRAGYSAQYVADMSLQGAIDNAGFIIVKIPPEQKTTPHAHDTLEEVFVIMAPTKMGVNEMLYDLDVGDVVLVEPQERHWFETPNGDDVVIVAIKMPNLKDDKIENG